MRVQILGSFLNLSDSEGRLNPYFFAFYLSLISALIGTLNSSELVFIVSCIYNIIVLLFIAVDKHNKKDGVKEIQELKSMVENIEGDLSAVKMQHGVKTLL